MEYFILILKDVLSLLIFKPMKYIHQFCYYCGSLTIAASLPTSRGFVVVGVILFITGMLFKLFDSHHKPPTIQQLKNDFGSKTAYPFLILGAPFIVLLLSGLYSENITPWLMDVKVEVIGLLLPLAALIYGKISPRFMLILQAIFIAACLISGFYSLGMYLKDFHAVNERIGRGHYLPHLVHPVRLSIMFSFGCIMGLMMYVKNHKIRYKAEPLIYLISGIILFIILHIFSVRTGIVITYAALAAYILHRMIMHFKPIHLLFILLIAVFPYLAYLFMPSLHTKINYMFWDWRQKGQEDAGQYSDSNRLLSLSVGLKIYEESPIVGHGSGDVVKKVQAYYNKYYPFTEKQLRPHNQFLSIAIESGVLGLLVFIFSLLYPLARGRWRHNPLFPLLTLQIVLSCLVENTLDNNVGLTFYLFWTCIFLMEWKSAEVKATDF